MGYYPLRGASVIPTSIDRSTPIPITHFPSPKIKTPPLSYATRVGDLPFVPGFDGNGKLPDTFEAQFGFVAATIKRLLAEAGTDTAHLVKVNVLLTRPADVAPMSALYAQAFSPPPYPARTTCVVAQLPDPKMLIEIECIASLAG